LCEHLDAGSLAAFEPEWTFMADWVATERGRQVAAATQPSAGRPVRSRKR
jgi:hypothetical protein